MGITSQETHDFTREALKIDSAGSKIVPYFGRLIAERRRLALIVEMMTVYGAPSHAQEGWISRLIPLIQSWDSGTPLQRINERLRTFVSDERENKGIRKGIFEEREGSALDIFFIFGQYGGVKGEVVRWVRDRKIDRSSWDYRTNQVVEAMSMVILRGLVDSFSYDKPEALKSIRTTLETLKESADETRQELATFAIKVINTTIHERAQLV